MKGRVFYAIKLSYDTELLLLQCVTEGTREAPVSLGKMLEVEL